MTLTRRYRRCSREILPMYRMCGAAIMRSIITGKGAESIIMERAAVAMEKHVPDYKVEGNLVKVNVGSVDHPMLAVHYIEWIALKTKEGVQIKYLKPEDKPCASFALSEGDEVEEVYAYCNIHGLWKA